MGPFLQSTDRNWHEIAEVTLYTLIGWEVLLFFLYLLTLFGHEAKDGLLLTWLMSGMLQVWAIKQTLPQFSNQQAGLTIAGWGFIPLLFGLFDQILGESFDYSLGLIVVSGLIGQVLQLGLIKPVVVQISIR